MAGMVDPSADTRTLAEILQDAKDRTRCPFCRKVIGRDDFMYQICGGSIDSELGLCESPDGLWACHDCVSNAEEDSLMARPRERYPDDFRGFGPR